MKTLPSMQDLKWLNVEDPPSRAGLAHRLRHHYPFPEFAKSTGYRDTRLKATELHNCSQGLQNQAQPLLRPCPIVVFSFLPVSYFSVWPEIDPPSSCIFPCLGVSHFKSVCHPPLNLKAHSLLWAFLPLGSQGSLRVMHLEVLWRRHWG